MIFNVKTKEGDLIKLKEVVGCRFYHVPLKEIVGSFFCKYTNRYIPIHAIEVFELYPEVELGGIDDLYVEKYTKKLRSIGLSEKTLELISD